MARLSRLFGHVIKKNKKIIKYQKRKERIDFIYESGRQPEVIIFVYLLKLCLRNLVTRSRDESDLMLHMTTIPGNVFRALFFKVI